MENTPRQPETDKQPHEPPSPIASVQKRYNAARIAPAVLLTVIIALNIIRELAMGGWMTLFLVADLYRIGILVAVNVFCFAPVAKWRVSRTYHISYPIAILCALYPLLTIIISIAEQIPLFDYWDIPFVVAEVVCFVVQYLIGKKHPQILAAESLQLETLREKYYYGGKDNAQV